MGITRAHIVKNDSLEDRLGDYVGGKPRRASLGAAAKHSSRLVAALTCLQLAFAIYATFLLYYMSPAVDLRVKPDFAWATRIAQRWKQSIMPGAPGGGDPLSPQEVCEHESIEFEQKKSTDALMIDLRTI